MSVMTAVKNYAIVGIGGRSTLFARALAERRELDLRLAAICDSNPVRLEAYRQDLARDYGINPAALPADRFDLLLRDPELDTVIICTPDNTHADYICRTLAAGKNVVVEKPLAIDAVQCTRILATLRKDIKLDDNIVALLEIGDRCMGYVDAGWTSRGGFSGVEIMGDNGFITADYGKGKVTVTYGVTSPDGTIKMTEDVLLEGGSRPHWTTQMTEFTRKLADGSAPYPGISDGLEALKITLACYESSREGKRIVIQ